MRPPVCDVCDADADPTGGGASVRFQPDDRSRAWRLRAEEEGFVGHPPDTGWFCPAHVEAAREAARTLTLPEGLRRISPGSRAVDVTTVTFPDPVDLPPATPIPERSVDAVRRVLAERRHVLAASVGIGAGDLRSSTSFGLDDAHHRSVTHIVMGPIELFERVESEQVDGEAVVRLVEERAVRDGAVVALVRVGPLDRLQVWVGDERVRPWVESIAAELASGPRDLLDPSPDLVGVDLGSGRLAGSDRFDLQWVAWDLVGIDAHEMARSLREALAPILDALQLGEPPTLSTRTDRRWNPMDGAQPPYCPFTDSTFHEGVTAGGTPVVVQVVLEHWDDDDVSNATVSLAIGDVVSISAASPTGGGRVIRSVWLHQPTTEAVVRIVDRLTEPPGSTTP